MDSEFNARQVDEFKVNAWMRSIGFEWDIPPEQPLPFKGVWLREGYRVTQEHAVFWYKVAHPKKWWQS